MILNAGLKKFILPILLFSMLCSGYKGLSVIDVFSHPAIPEISLDPSQIDRVFINLINNAIKFTPIKGKINVAASLENNIVTVEVSDTGIGIKEDDAKKLFDEFYRVDNEINQQVKGTGLGLSLAKKIVEAHQGRIWVTSKIGQGTTFYFTLPVDGKIA